MATRDHLLAAAQRMFCEAGFHAISVDSIVENAGVARMTLYENFGSKEDLIAATLRREDKMFRQWLVSSVEARSSRPEDRLLGLFAALHDRFSTEGYYGCAFIRASIEFPAPNHPVHRAAREHKEMIRSSARHTWGQPRDRWVMLVERLTAAEIQLRSPPVLTAAA
jgi:AcrR family transcriptional regulator